MIVLTGDEIDDSDDDGTGPSAVPDSSEEMLRAPEMNRITINRQLRVTRRIAIAQGKPRGSGFLPAAGLPSGGEADMTADQNFHLYRGQARHRRICMACSGMLLLPRRQTS